VSTTSDLPLVLVIDDVSPMVRLIELELGFQGFRTSSRLIQQNPVEEAESLQPNGIVLGSSLPSPAVYDVLQQLKRRVAAPVVFLHNGGSESDAALALEMGADETLAQPVRPDELGMRLRVLLSHDAPKGLDVRRGPLRIDVLHRIVWNGDAKRALATNEWTLLIALLQAESPMSAEALLRDTWGPEYAQERGFLKLWIDKLRINIGDDPRAPALILGDVNSGFALVR
jgi:two-component system, OmpR family, KDP operon response regulator KdpE